MPYDFVVRMRAHAAAHFDWGDILTVTWPFAEAKLQSEYTGGEDERAYRVPEQRLMAGEFLFICAETLSRFMIEARAAALGITPKNLAQKEKAA